MLPCPAIACDLRQPQRLPTACSAWDGSQFDLSKIFGAAADRPDNCAFLVHVLRPTARRVTRRLRTTALASDEAVSIVVVQVLRNSQRLPVTDRELERFTRQRVIDDLRRLREKERNAVPIGADEGEVDPPARREPEPVVEPSPVEKAMARLALADPAAALVFYELEIVGAMSQEDLGRQLGKSRDQIKRQLAKAKDLLRSYLPEFAGRQP